MEFIIEEKLESTKRFWDRNKGKLAVIATATTIGMVMLSRAQAKTVDGFLKEKGLLEEFWTYIGADEDDIASFTK